MDLLGGDSNDFAKFAFAKLSFLRLTKQFHPITVFAREFISKKIRWMPRQAFGLSRNDEAGTIPRKNAESRNGNLIRLCEGVARSNP